MLEEPGNKSVLTQLTELAYFYVCRDRRFDDNGNDGNDDNNNDNSSDADDDDGTCDATLVDERRSLLMNVADDVLVLERS